MRINRKKLAITMINADLSVSKLVERSELSRATVSAIKNGKSCQAATAMKLAKALNVELEELLEEG
ncbi:MAG TPA: XRE family transcriptional regulator [Clostridiales bacterium]|nr:XRE family transcriptional regulator [Clostridiales bacterium]